MLRLLEDRTNQGRHDKKYNLKGLHRNLPGSDSQTIVSKAAQGCFILVAIAGLVVFMAWAVPLPPNPRTGSQHKRIRPRPSQDIRSPKNGKMMPPKEKAALTVVRGAMNHDAFDPLPRIAPGRLELLDDRPKELIRTRPIAHSNIRSRTGEFGRNVAGTAKEKPEAVSADPGMVDAPNFGAEKSHPGGPDGSTSGEIVASDEDRTG